MRLLSFVVLAVLASTSAFAQESLTGSWKLRVLMNSQDFYGNHCIARTIRSGGVTADTISDTSDVSLTANGVYISGSSGPARVNGTRHGKSIAFSMMHFPDSSTETIDTPTCGEWVLTGWSNSHMGVFNGCCIAGTFVATLFVQQNNNNDTVRVQGIFTMWRAD